VDIAEQVKKARSLMECEIKITKQLYKAIDSYQRRERWIGRQIIKAIMEQYGLAKAKEIQ
jgi:hypothetical protein